MSTLVDFVRANWHEVPSDAVIPDDMEFAVIWSGDRRITQYAPDETGTHFRKAGCRFPRFTPEPLTEPEPEFVLPTKPGSVVIAATATDERHPLVLRDNGEWQDSYGGWLDWELTDPEPARVVPNGIGVMDETDKRDRIDDDGDRWEWGAARELWHRSDCPASSLMYGTLASLNLDAGPLRFADEGGDAA